MTWTMLGDEFADQCWKLSNGAWRLHVEGLIWSNRKYLDGRLPKDELGRWVKHPEFVPELLEIGWWSDEPEHLIINQWAFLGLPKATIHLVRRNLEITQWVLKQAQRQSKNLEITQWVTKTETQK
jgi:hypothetical protein